MTFEPLANRIDDLPLVICGPILRRTEYNSVSVWIACKAPVSQLRLTIWRYDTENNTAGDIVLEGIGSTRMFGERLHIAVISADSAESGPGLNPNQIYIYDIFFEIDGSYKALYEKNILSKDGKLTLGYGSLLLPSFCLPAHDINDLKIVHGSCRKPNGGKTDALRGLDYMLETWAMDPKQRPQLLCLHGDQIYADEVADLLLYMLMDAESVLIWNDPNAFDGVWNPSSSQKDTYERLPYKDPPASEQPVQYGFAKALPITRLQWLRPGFRKKLVADSPDSISEDNLSTLDAESHLISLGEFYMMYLFVWADTLWPESFPETNHILYGGLTNSGAAGDPPIYSWLDVSVLNRYKEQSVTVKEFKRSLSKVRKALANIPSYMIFDDHEFTDDPFLTAEWAVALKKGTLSRRLLQNGFAAYAVFQDWGNNPQKYSSGQGSALFDSLKLLVEKRGVVNAYLWEIPGDQLLPELTTSGSNTRMTGGFKWHYHVDFYSLRLIALNTRTQREYTSKTSPSMLISPARMDEQLAINEPRPAGYYSSSPLTVILSPAPILGNIILELGQAGLRTKSLVWVIKGVKDWLKFEPTGMYHKDQEAWIFNQHAFQTLLSKFVQFERVLILSGDVHSSSTCAAYYVDERTSTPRTAVFGQLTSSALKNSTSDTHMIATKKLFRNSSRYDFYGWEIPGKHLIEWKYASGGFGWMVHTTVSGKPAILMVGVPKLSELVTNDESVQKVKNAKIADPPDWRYAIFFEEDIRQSADRFFPVTVDPSETLSSEIVRVARQQYLSNKLESMVVGYDCICLITFDWSPGFRKVTHEIWYAIDSQSMIQPHTKHEFTFEPKEPGSWWIPPIFDNLS
jgi:hypothetical protein